MSTGLARTPRLEAPAGGRKRPAPGPPRLGLLERAGIGWKLARALLTGRRFPLVAGWNLTYRCNLRCSYCGTWRDETPEMPTAEVLSLADELATLGTRFVGFSGGETLLREDIGAVVDRCAEHGMKVSIQSNGTLLPERVGELGRVAEIQLGIDGPPEINDSIRGRGAYDAVVRAMEICLTHGISVCLSAVVSSRNLEHLGHVLELAEAHDAGVYFQPADESFTRRRPTGDVLLPERGAYREAMAWLLAEKARGRKAICNSRSGLKHLMAWPEPPPLKCLAALIALNIEPDGKLSICDMYPGYEGLLEPVDHGLRAAFDRLRLPRECDRCLSASRVDFNLLLELRLDALWGLWRRA